MNGEGILLSQVDPGGELEGMKIAFVEERPQPELLVGAGHVGCRFLLPGSPGHPSLQFGASEVFDMMAQVVLSHSVGGGRQPRESF